MSDWLTYLAEAARHGADGVLVTLAGAEGSTPRAAGTRMLVTRDGAFGTVGGGHLEFAALEAARRLLGGAGGDWRRFPLGPALGQCCGGRATLLFEPVPGPREDSSWDVAHGALDRLAEPAVLASLVRKHSVGGKMLVTRAGAEGKLGDRALGARVLDEARDMLRDGKRSPRLTELGEAAVLLLEPVCPRDFHVALFGAGHVGRAVVQVLAGLPCRITWIDSRPEQFPERAPANVSIEVSDAPERDVEDAPAGSVFVVMTHSHQLDLRLAERILRRGDFSYFGLIGSATKRTRFEARLRRRGVPAETIQRMTCPIGIAGIPGKHPAEIAIALAAEILHGREARQAGRGIESLSA